MEALGWDGWFCLAVVGVIFVVLTLELAPTDMLLMGAATLFGLTGIIGVKDVFAGFSNSGMLTVAALFVVVAGLRETGALTSIGNVLLGKTRTEGGALLRLSFSVTTLSAFLNNTPIVAMMLPVLSAWCKKNQVSPSRLLMPLSFLTVLGGTCTLIGTSTNLVVDGLMRKNFEQTQNLSLKPMTLFELAYAGLPCALLGMTYLYFIGRRLLPERKDLIEQLGDRTRDYLVNLRIMPGCRLIGKRIEEAGLRHLPGLFLIEITRGEAIISPVGPDQVMEGGDILTFTGVVANIVELERIPGLVPTGDESYEERATSRRGMMLCEAVISSTSPLIGKSIRDAEFRSMYNAAVVAVHRGGERLHGRVGDIVLRNGDTLLLQTGTHFARSFRNHPDFFLVSRIEESRPVRHDRAWISLVLLALFVGLLVTEKVDTAVSAFLVAGLMIVTRCISSNEARRSVDYQTLITIAASFAIGDAMLKSGVVETLTGAMLASLGTDSPWLVLFAIYFLTLVVTELITNNAAAVLMFPFALTIAGHLGVDPRPFVIAVTLAASNAFSIPLGYQTHLMVYGPGGYRFTDFIKVGMPLDLICMGTACTIIPFVWPF